MTEPEPPVKRYQNTEVPPPAALTLVLLVCGVVPIVSAVLMMILAIWIPSWQWLATAVLTFIIGVVFLFLADANE